MITIDVPIGQGIPNNDTDLYIWQWMLDNKITWSWHTYERLVMPEEWVLCFRQTFDL